MRQGELAVGLDPRGLEPAHRVARRDEAGALTEAAARFEALFIDMLLRAMRETGSGDGLFGSSTVDGYRAMMDSQLAETLARHRSFGLAGLMEQALGSRTQPSAAALPAPVDRPTGASARAQSVGGGVRPGQVSSRHRLLMDSEPRQPATEPLRNPGDPAAFVEQLLPFARRHADALGVRPQVLLAQAALETGWGGRIMRSADGERSSYNLFGIKALRDWDGPRVLRSTLEFESGVATRRTEPFRAYRDFDAAFADYVAFIKESPRYASALRRVAEPAAYLHALQQAGYATDPAYARKILDILGREPLLAPDDAAAPGYFG